MIVIVRHIPLKVLGNLPKSQPNLPGPTSYLAVRHTQQARKGTGSGSGSGTGKGTGRRKGTGKEARGTVYGRALLEGGRLESSSGNSL